jgi:hypothetical protein
LYTGANGPPGALWVGLLAVRRGDK